MRNPDTGLLPRLARLLAPAGARWLAAPIVALGAATGLAAPALLTVEECLETGTGEVSLPGVAGGTLSASPCPGCPTLRLRFAGNTRFLVGKEAVTYARFRELAAKGDTRLDLFYEPKTRTLTRMRLAASGNAQ